MHEFGLCESFVEAITRARRGPPSDPGPGTHRHAASRQHRSLRAGLRVCLVGTVAEAASVEVVTTAAVFDCPACDVRTESDELLALCPACGDTSLRLVGGNELVLESIRLADPAPSQVVAVEQTVASEPDDGHTHDDGHCVSRHPSRPVGGEAGVPGDSRSGPRDSRRPARPGRVDVSGVKRAINIGLLDDEPCSRATGC